MQRKVGIGIIGLGMASAPHAKSLLDLKSRARSSQPSVLSSERREAFAAAYGFPVRDSAEAIFDDPAVEALLLLTPPNTHLDLVRRAASAGKHILLEKPLEISLERAEELVTVAEKAGIKLGIVLQHRFRPISIALSGLIREGRLGDIVSASARLYNWRPQSYYDQPGRGTKARDGGGVLLTQAIHTLDLMISLAGLPVEVTGYADHQPRPPHGDGRPRFCRDQIRRTAASARSAPPPRPIPAYPTPWTSSAPRAWPGSKARV